jgi:hypothetical protein
MQQVTTEVENQILKINLYLVCFLIKEPRHADLGLQI